MKDLALKNRGMKLCVKVFCFLMLCPIVVVYAEHKNQKINEKSDSSCPSELIFQQADDNDDGFLTIREFERIQNLTRRFNFERLFDLLDVDKNGQLSKNEMAPDAFLSARRTLSNQKMFGRLDRNNDGQINIEEFRTRAKYRAEHHGSKKIM
tara:strand:- start:1406 stop:1861 length:456 start_codon:yes stop_codon:yes gene_type:complete